MRYIVCCAALALCAVLPAFDVYRCLSSDASVVPSYAPPVWAAEINQALPPLVLLWSIGVLGMAGRLAMGVVWVRHLRQSGLCDLPHAAPELALGAQGQIE